jgi:hypothetical protein
MPWVVSQEVSLSRDRGSKKGPGRPLSEGIESVTSPHDKPVTGRTHCTLIGWCCRPALAIDASLRLRKVPTASAQIKWTARAAPRKKRAIVTAVISVGRSAVWLVCAKRRYSAATRSGASCGNSASSCVNTRRTASALLCWSAGIASTAAKIRCLM